MMMMMMMMMMICCNHHNCVLFLLLSFSSSSSSSSSSSNTISFFVWGNRQTVSNPLHLYTVCPALYPVSLSPVFNILAEPFCSWSSHTHLLYVPLSILVLSTYVYRQTAVDSFFLHSVNSILITPCSAQMLLSDPVTCCVSLQHCNTLNCVTFVLLQSLTAGWLFDYSFRCQPVDYSNNPQALRVSNTECHEWDSRFLQQSLWGCDAM